MLNRYEFVLHHNPKVDMVTTERNRTTLKTNDLIHVRTENLQTSIQPRSMKKPIFY
jgi:hypothetical protein